MSHDNFQAERPSSVTRIGPQAGTATCRTLASEAAWDGLLAIRRWSKERAREDGVLSVLSTATGTSIVPGRVPTASFWSFPGGRWESPTPAHRQAATLLDLYLPLCRAARPAGRPYVIAHLGQSLDGRIATVSGSSQWVTGAADLVHTHRMRALADAVVVGAGTVRADDPQLTVRRVAGENPLRVVIDSRRRLSADHRVFCDGAAPTLLVCAEDELASGPAPAGTEVAGIPRRGSELEPSDICALLAARGVSVLFLEGGGLTVSRFLQASCVDRLQLTVAPIILGSGRPAISLPEVTEIGHGMRPRVRHFVLDDDVMFECAFNG